MSTYRIGKGKPPKKTRFKKGQSGNPTGRPKGSKNLKTLIEEQQNALVTVRENGVEKKISTKKAVIMRLHAEALRGNQRAIQAVLNMAEDTDGGPTRNTNYTALDMEIIRRFASPLLAITQEGEDNEP
jgi:hypothetical protein